MGRYTGVFVLLTLLASCSSLGRAYDSEPDDNEVTAGAGGSSSEPMKGGAGGKSSGGKAGGGGSGAASPQAEGGEGGAAESGETGGAGAKGAAGSGGEDSGGEDSGGCTEITATFREATIDPFFANYEFFISPDIRGKGSDYLTVGFYWDDELDGDAPGVFQIEGSPDADYATCARCVYAYDEQDTAYWATSGTIVVAQDSDHMHGQPQVVLSDFTLVEVNLQKENGAWVTEPVPNGACLHLENLVLDEGPNPEGVPEGWDCAEFYYLDGECDCGCGVVDADCESPAAECDYDWCGASAAPDPTDNSQCIAL
jgi:hypothetical protein